MSTIEVKVPDIGDFKDVPVIEVFVKPGQDVAQDESLVTLESDKATMDVPSPAAGRVKDLKVKVQPPADITAGNYQVKITAAAANLSADLPLSMEITGQPHLRLSGKDDRLSGSAEAGKSSTVDLVLSNDGSAPAQNIAISASAPSQWNVTFSDKSIDQLAPGETKTVTAFLEPPSKALAGDYMTTFRANAGGESSSADFRISVTTSTLWGIVGVGLIAVALLVLVGAGARFGRR